MHTEYRLTAEGRLLDPGTTDPQEYAAATRRWIVQTLPEDHERQRVVQVAAMAAGGVVGVADAGARSLAEAVLVHPGGTAVVPDDVIALRIALLSLHEAHRPVRAARVHVVARHDVVVTTSVDGDALARLVERVRVLPVPRRRGAFVVTRALLSLALEDATAVAERITTRTASLEDLVFTSTEPDETIVGNIYRLKRTIAEVRRHLQPVVNRLALVVEVDDEELGGDAVSHIERIEAGFRRVTDGMETDDRLLGDMLTAQLTFVQVQQNSDMRRISAYAALITVPTLIAGIYGMNFRHMPELLWVWGYPGAIALMIVAVLGLRTAFTRSGWLSTRSGRSAATTRRPSGRARR